MKLLRVQRSDRVGKKFAAIFLQDNGRTKTVHFGDSSMEDYLIHHDKERRERYRQRHRKDLDTGDPTRAGYLSWYLLWGDHTSLNENIKYYKKKYGF